MKIDTKFLIHVSYFHRQVPLGPRFIRIGKRTIRYLKEDLDHWLNQCGEIVLQEDGDNSEVAA